MNKTYLITILLLPVIIIGCYASVVYHVDPYGFYKPLDRGSFPIKPAMTQNQNMAKAQIVRKTKPDTVIIGSSRVDHAIAPNHEYFKGKNVYNFGLQGIRMPELRQVIQHAVHSGAKEIVWGLDFFSFNVNIPIRADFSKDRLYNDDRTNELDTGWKTLISISSAKAVAKTLWHQNNKNIATTYINGQHSPHELDHKTQKNGTEYLFTNNAHVFLGKLYFPSPSRTFAFKNDHEDAFKDFTDTLEFLKDNNIKTTIFIAPQHAYHYTIIHQSGLFETYKKWTSKTQKIIKNQKFKLFNYTDILKINSEPIDRPLTHYWESSHYKPTIGNMILDDLMSNPSPLGIFTNFSQFERDLVRYQCDNPDIVKDIRNKIIKSGLENRLIQKLNCR